jgi:hypothetical protein
MAKKIKAPQDSVLSEEQKDDVLTPDYSDAEQTYIKNLQSRLTKAKDKRDGSHEEFDGLSFSEYWWSIERAANTNIEPNKNKHDQQFQSGTLRTKMLAFLSAFAGLNLQVDISAFDDTNVLVTNLGNAMETIIDKTHELENDEEKKMLRQYELLKHGYVFLEEVWDERWKVEKEVKRGMIGQKNFTWTSKLKKMPGQAIRNIIPGVAVYLGDITKYFLEDQPYIYTVEVDSYDNAEKTYGEWDMWKYVSKKKKSFAGASDLQMIQNAWRLVDDVKENEVEIVKYQDKWNNEYQVIINGVPMLPMGFPLTAVRADGEYTIVQQNLEPIRHTFAYGKSFIFKNKNIVAILDEMMKLAVLKTKKSFLPPYLNLSKRYISKDIFMPGKISRGISKGEIAPITDKEVQGVTTGEFNMIQEVIQFIDRNTASQTFGGAREQGGNVTATQIIELQRQARVMMGLLVLAATLLEKKIGWLRLMTIIEKWFDPADKEVDAAKNVLVNKYRTVSMPANIDGKGMGMKMVIPSENIPSSEMISQAENNMQESMGLPVKIMMLNPEMMKQAKLTWVLNANPREKKTSELSKMLFGAMISEGVNLGLRFNPSHVEERFAEVWEENPSKLFMQQAMPGQQPMAQQGQQQGAQSPNVISPKMSAPGMKQLSQGGILQ